MEVNAERYRARVGQRSKPQRKDCWRDPLPEDWTKVQYLHSLHFARVHPGQMSNSKYYSVPIRDEKARRVCQEPPREESSEKHCRIGAMETTFGVVLMLALATFSDAAETSSRFARMLQIPNSAEVIVVTEGDFEGRSGGSYALRIYGGSSRKYPLDDFVTGTIRPRRGTIERVLVDSIGGGNAIEIIVVIRSAGSGGYLSVDAFRYRAKSLVLVASVSGLDKRTDPLVALRDKAKRQPKQ